MQETSDKFLDLGLEDGNQSDFNNMIQKQQMFQKECERLNFHFESSALSIPKGSTQSSEEILSVLEEQPEDALVGKYHKDLGVELDRIHDLLFNSIRKSMMSEDKQIIQSSRYQ